MEFTNREFWTLIHGMGFGALFLLAFGGGLAGLYSLRPELLTATGLRERMTRLVAGTWLMAIAAWGTVITGTFIVYPWYRAAAPKGADLTAFPRSFLLANPNLAEWHTFGMEWKEHVAWLAPILATVVAFVLLRYGKRLAEMPFLRKTLMVTFVLAFGAAAIAGLMGALITKAAPIQ
jgi:phosphoglycerol transferase MdoB-like AlkP superfamily enzyme